MTREGYVLITYIKSVKYEHIINPTFKTKTDKIDNLSISNYYILYAIKYIYYKPNNLNNMRVVKCQFIIMMIRKKGAPHVFVSPVLNTCPCINVSSRIKVISPSHEARTSINSK